MIIDSIRLIRIGQIKNWFNLAIENKHLLATRILSKSIDCSYLSHRILIDGISSLRADSENLQNLLNDFKYFFLKKCLIRAILVGLLILIKSYLFTVYC